MSIFPRYQAPKVNRSFAFDPETLATLIAIITKAVQDTTVAFAAELDKLDINVEDRTELIRSVCEGIASGSADIIEKWKDSHRQPVRAK
jgi:hypothetical protein